MLYDVILPEPSISFSVTSWLVTITVTVSSDVTGVWQCDHNTTLTLTLDPNKEKRRELNKKANIQALHL